MGWLQDFVSNPVGTVTGTVTDFIDNPAKSVGDAWNSGGREAAALAAMYYGGSALMSAGGAGAGAAAAGEGTVGSLLGASGMGALDVGGIGLGIGGAAGAGAAGAGLSQYAMPAAILGSSLLGSNAANRAASTQADAAERSAALQKQIADQQIAWQREQFERQNALSAPWRAAGEQSLNRLSAGLRPGGEFGSAQKFQFGPSEFAAGQDPGYAFRLSEGLKGLERTAAARGGLVSGGALKAATRYGQEMGSQEYQNAFNRAVTGFNANRQGEGDLFNRLSGVAGTGQTAVQQLGTAGQNMTSGMSSALGGYGQSAGDAYMGAANARASGYVGGVNALTGGLGQWLNYSQQQSRNAMDQQWLNNRQTGGYDNSPVDMTGFQTPYSPVKYGG